MARENAGNLTEKAFESPLLAKLSDLAEELALVRFGVVFPQLTGWGQSFPGGPDAMPEFCKLIQQAPDGPKHCRMCHVLMAVAACGGAASQQRCHAGIAVLVSPLTRGSKETIAVLSACFLTPELRAEAWNFTKERSKKLGINPNKLKKAYDELPDPDTACLKRAQTVMTLASEAAKEARDRFLGERELAELRDLPKPRNGAQAAVARELRNAMSIQAVGEPRTARRKKGRNPHALVDVVSELVGEKPAMPFSVSTIAAVARITPNHFSSLFHKHKGLSFSEFLTEKRIATAKQLLRDLTMNIGEVAVRAGFDDPGYFARRFRQATGLTPREWRHSLMAK